MVDQNLLYIDLAAFEEGKVLRGGALVVGAGTEPLEFRCTDAVRPTKLQKVLWGARMDGYVATELFGKPLIRATRQKYSLVVVRNRDMLDLRPELEVTVVHLSRDASIEFEPPRRDAEDEEPTGQGEDAGGDEGADETANPLLATPSGRFEPVVLRCHEGYPDDMREARRVLRPIFAARDVMEPFERVGTALQMVHEQRSTDSGRER